MRRNNDLALIRADVLTARYILPIELTNGNEGRTKHFSASAKRRKQYATTLGWMFKNFPTYQVPVTVAVVRILGPKEKPWDSSSGLRGNWKEIEDALVASGVFLNDSPQYIEETRFFQDDEQRQNGPCIELLITKRGY